MQVRGREGHFIASIFLSLLLFVLCIVSFSLLSLLSPLPSSPLSSLLSSPLFSLFDFSPYICPNIRPVCSLVCVPSRPLLKDRVSLSSFHYSMPSIQRTWTATQRTRKDSSNSSDICYILTRMTNNTRHHLINNFSVAQRAVGILISAKFLRNCQRILVMRKRFLFAGNAQNEMTSRCSISPSHFFHSILSSLLSPLHSTYQPHPHFSSILSLFALSSLGWWWEKKQTQRMIFYDKITFSTINSKAIIVLYFPPLPSSFFFSLLTPNS